MNPAFWRASAAATVAAAMALLYLPVFVRAAAVWASNPELSFGFAVPVIVATLLWLRRSTIQAAVSQGGDAGLIPLMAGVLVWLGAVRLGVHALAGASLLLTFPGAVFYLYGGATTRLLAFPTALLTGSLVLYHGLLDSLGFVLQRLTAVGAADVAGLLGMPVRRSGVDLFTSNAHFVIAQACSGMDSLLALLCLGALILGLATGPLPRRLLLVALVLPIILAANIIRVTLVLALSLPFGSAVAEGLPHAALSAALFISTVVLFILAAVSLRCVPRFDVISSSPR